jgi:hypothetical protein
VEGCGSGSGQGRGEWALFNASDRLMFFFLGVGDKRLLTVEGGERPTS